jgi:hypothetical protein
MRSLYRILSVRSSQIIYIISIISLAIVWWFFTEIAVMVGNYGKLHTSIDIILSITTILLFPLFLLGLYHRGKVMKTFNDTSSPSWTVGIIWGILATIISGSSCCGLTLALYFWLMPIMNILPYDGLELKTLGLLGLLYGLYQVLMYLEVCKAKNI